MKSPEGFWVNNEDKEQTRERERELARLICVPQMLRSIYNAAERRD
jgi:hypothetical protein